MHYLARELSKEKDVVIAAAKQSDPSIIEEKIKLYNNLRYTARDNILVRIPLLLWATFTIWKIARKENPDLLFAKNSGVFLPTYVAGKFLGKKVSCAVGSFPYRGLNRRIVNVLLNLNWDIIFTSGEELKRYCEGITRSHSKIVDVGNAVDRELFKPVDKKKSKKEVGLPSKDRVILYAGSFEKIKRLDMLIEWFSKAGLSDTTLLLVGDGPDKEKLKSIARESNPDNVLFMEAVEYRKMPYLYSAAEVFVLNSEREGIPRTVVESLACGRPVLVHEPAGRYFKQFNTSGIVYYETGEEFLEKLNSILEEKPVFNTDFIEKHFSWSSVAERFAQAFNNSDNK